MLIRGYNFHLEDDINENNISEVIMKHENCNLHDKLYEAFKYISSSVYFVNIGEKFSNFVKEKFNLDTKIITTGFAIGIKDSKRTAYDWHQETFYTIPKSNYIQTWSPLIYPSTTENGTIEICPKSHLEGIPKQNWYQKKNKAIQILINKKIIEKYEPLSVNINPGDVLLFSGRLAHKSGRNLSNKVRFSLVGMYHDVNSKHFKSAKIKFIFRDLSPKKYFKEYKEKWK